MEIIELDYLENTPLSTQLSRLTGEGWHTGYWEDENGADASAYPKKIIKNIKTGQLFRMPKKQSKIIDYLYESWDFKMKAVWLKSVIQISEDTYDHLLGCVPPVRMGGGAFLVGEAMTHCSGKAVYCSCFTVNEKYFLTFQMLSEYESKDYLKRYENHLLIYDIF